MCVTKFKQTEGKMNLRGIDVQTVSVQPLESKKENVKQAKSVETVQGNTVEEKKGSNALSSYFRGGQAVNFTGFPCSKSKFNVKQEEGVPCSCCGRLMMTSKGVDNFVKKAANAKGEYLQEVLSANMEFFRGTEKSVVNFFMKTSQKNPDANMKDLLVQYAPNAKVLLEEEQKNVLAEVSQKASVLGKDNPIQQRVERALVDIANSTDAKHFERKPFLKDIADLTGRMEDKELGGQILDSAVKLPMSKTSIESFIVKYSHSDKSGEDIARRLSQPAIATAEHIHPDTLGGPDNTANYMSECADCNNKRGHMPYSEWMENYPNMPRSVQRNIDEVTERIINGNLGSRYDDYPLDLQQAIDRETDGVIKLKVKNPEEIDKAREERGIPKPVDNHPHPPRVNK